MTLPAHSSVFARARVCVCSSTTSSKVAVSVQRDGAACRQNKSSSSSSSSKGQTCAWRLWGNDSDANECGDLGEGGLQHNAYGVTSGNQAEMQPAQTQTSQQQQQQQHKTKASTIKACRHTRCSAIRTGGSDHVSYVCILPLYVAWPRRWVERGERGEGDEGGG